jgi:hypothetical protein
LIEVHIWLREELARLREGAGRGERPRELQVHCAAFCSALSRHHTSEDSRAFPALVRDFPELHPVLAELEADHQIVAAILQKIQALSTDDAEGFRTELDTLSALLESHFVYEEKKIAAALNQITGEALELLGIVPGWQPEGGPPSRSSN